MSKQWSLHGFNYQGVDYPFFKGSILLPQWGKYFIELDLMLVLWFPG